MKHVIFDVETKKSFDDVGGYFPDKLGVSFVGAIVRESLPELFGEKVKEERLELFEKDLDRLWPVFERVDVIIGFNSEGFDLTALKPYYPGDITKLPSLDLMARFKETQGHRISLDAIAIETLGTKKSGDGLDAIRYFEEGKLEELAMYCMKDVEITRDVYDFGRLNRKVKYKNKWNDVVEGKVDFSFEMIEDAGLQMSLI